MIPCTGSLHGDIDLAFGINTVEELGAPLRFLELCTEADESDAGALVLQLLRGLGTGLYDDPTSGFGTVKESVEEDGVSLSSTSFRFFV